MIPLNIYLQEAFDAIEQPEPAERAAHGSSTRP